MTVILPGPRSGAHEPSGATESEVPVSVLSDPLFSHVLGAPYLYDPYPALASVRERMPVFRSRLGPWVVTSHQLVSAALRHPDLIADPRGSAMYRRYLGAHHGRDFGRQALSSMQFRDGQEHLRIRRAFAAFLNAAERKARHRAWIRELANSLADELGRVPAPVDFVTQFARRLPALMLCRMLDLPAADADQLAQMAESLVAADDPEFLLDESRHAITERASVQASRYFGLALVHRRKHLGDDLLSHLLSSLEAHDLCSLEELVVNLIFFLVAGIKTTTDLLGNAVYALGNCADVWAQVRADRSGVPKLVEECFRHDSPIQQTPRFAACALELGGARIEGGAHVMLMLAAANRDPSVFVDPDRLQPERHNIREHVGFGGGAHHCLGSMLARQAAEAALAALTERFSELRLEAGRQRAVGFTLRGFRRLPVTPVRA